MKCPRCNADNPDPARYCEDCGARLELSCPHCSQPVSLGKRFCRSCGAELTTDEQRAPAPQRYTPKHLAEKILTSRSALEGERKQVTVLFADLKGSLEILADRDPEEARQVLDPVLQAMMEAVHRYEGTVNQVMGDGIMALFGAPLAHEDHAVRACYAALAMQSSMRRLSADLRRLHGIEMQIRVGINSGEVIVRAIGSDLRMDYSAIGQTTHLAARMEQLAPAGGIRLTADTLRRAEGFVHVTPLGPTPVKGLTARVEVYELMGTAVARTRLQAAAARGLTRFVGRDEELEQLRKALEQARAGRGQVVAVVGEPGVGKSRLIYELLHSHRAHGWLILECTAVSYGKGTAYLPVVELLKSYLKIETQDGARVVREKVAGKVLMLDKSLEDTIPAVLALLDALGEDDPFRKLEPPQRRLRTLDAVKRLMLRESQVQPLLLLIEDLHWIDSETQAVLDSLIHSLPTSALQLIVSYRPEYRHAWGSKTYYRQLRVDPLLPDSADALLEALLGDGGALRPLKRLLIERTDGNPFFLEECVRALVETGVLLGERAAYRLAGGVPTIVVPENVQAVLAARMDRLPGEEKQLLQRAAVMGKDVPYQWLHAICGVTDDELARQLEHLQDAEFLYEAQLFPELEYTFKHALTQEVAYHSLPIEKRRHEHGQLARLLETQFADRVDDKAELLAYHYQQTGDAEKALVYLTVSARKAGARFAAVEASRYYEDAVTRLEELAPTQDRSRQRLALKVEQVDMLWVQGRYQQGHRLLNEVERLAGELGDLEGLARIHFQSGQYNYDQMQLDTAFAHQRACLALCEQLGCVAEMRRVYWGLGNSCRSVSEDPNERRARAIDFHRTGLDLADTATPDIFDVHNAHFLWLIHLFQLGDWPTAMGFLQRGEEIARRLPEGADLVHLALMKGSIGLSHLFKRRTQAYLDLLAESLEAAERAGSHIYTTISHYMLGQGHFLAGDLASAITHFETTLGIAEQTRNLFLPGALLWTAETQARLGRSAEAIDTLQRYQAVIDTVGSLEGLAWFPSRGVCHRVYGLVFAEAGEQARAAQEFDQSVALLTAHGYRPDLARTLVAFGELRRRQGRPAEARELFMRAASRFRDMEFTFEMERALGLLEAGAGTTAGADTGDI